MHDSTEIIMSMRIIIVTAIIRAIMVEMILRDNIRGRMDYQDFYHTPLQLQKCLGCSVQTTAVVLTLSPFLNVLNLIACSIFF